MGCLHTDGGHDGDGVKETASEAPLLIAVIAFLTPVPASLLRRHVHLVGVSFQQLLGQRRPVVRMKDVQPRGDVPQLSYVLVACRCDVRLDVITSVLTS